MGEGSDLIDAEEGELSSDSSSEVGGVKRKVQSSPSLPLSPLSLPPFLLSLSLHLSMQRSKKDESEVAKFLQ